MKCINFDELIQLLKEEKGATIKKEIRHEFGVYRHAVIGVSPYTISIEYIDVAGYQVPLNFTIEREGNNETVFLSSISQLHSIVLAA